ncbi:MAG TPA: GNAT family N-acetyltransferase [Tissierellaceae bacterium]|nr:GNAT family N-acetyltransferase [Tissierellaceae bacterium]
MDILITDRLILREWRESDSKDLYEYAKSELVGPNAGWTPHNNEKESKEIIRMFIDKGDVYAIVLKSEDKVIGSIGFHDDILDNTVAKLRQKEIGYVLNPKYWGKGIIPEAVNRVIEYRFEKLDLDLIWCGHFNFNTNSKRVIEKTGFKYKFTKDEKLKQLNNKEVKILYYYISKSDYFRKDK